VNDDRHDDGTGAAAQADPDLWIAHRHADPDHAPEPTDDRERRVVAALDRTRADLADHAAGTPAMPASLQADLARALAGESRPRPSRRRALLAAAVVVVVLVLAGAAVVAALAVGAAPREQAGPAPTVGVPPPEIPALRRDDGPAALRAGLGRTDPGPLADPARLAGCLVAHGVPPGVRPVGAREVLVDGVPGVALVLPTGVAARFRVLVVGAGCAPETPLTVSDTLVGR
jgi:hypothetical protein